MATITLTRVSPTEFTFTKQGGDLDGALVKSSDHGLYGQGAWMWAVDVCGATIGSGSGTFTLARAALLNTLEAVAPAFTD
jgi:hypothetical protein